MTILIHFKQNIFLYNATALAFDHFQNWWLLKISKVEFSNKNSEPVFNIYWYS